MGIPARIIESSDFLWGLLGGYGVWRIAVWKYRDNLSGQNIEIIKSWLWSFGSVTFYLTWLGFSRKFAPDGLVFTPGMYEWRHIVIVLTSFGFAWGILSFLAGIDGYGNEGKAIRFLVCVTFAYLLGFT